ncbi:MAG: MFS transporter [Burkholderiaceae bacterium]
MTTTQAQLERRVSPHISMFFLGSALWFSCIGIQTVLFPWLLTNVLFCSPRWVGVAQMCVMLPIIFFILPAGHVADKVCLRRHLQIIQALAAVPPILLGIALSLHALEYWHLIAYALFMGVLTAFANPAREALLNRLGQHNLEKAVTINIGIEFGIQVAGFALGGLAAVTAPEHILYLQSALMIVGVYAIGAIKNIGSPSICISSSMVKEIYLAFNVVRSTPILRTVTFLNLMIGICFLGSFFVIVPIAITRSFEKGVTDIAIANISFMAGTISAVVGLVVLGGIKRRGRALLLACGCGALILGTMFFTPNWKAFLSILFLWGLCGGIALCMGQTLVQENIDTRHKGRILAIFLLCFMGGNPIGSFLIGNLLEYVDPLRGASVPAGLMLTVVLILAKKSELWRS